MNLLIRLCIVMLCLPALASAQMISQSKVPATVRSSFNLAHPKIAKVTWELEKGVYEASFVSNGLQASELYSKSGALTESEIEIKISALPAGVLPFVKNHYKSAQIKGAAKITKANREINYETAITGRDLIFDSNGKFLKVVKQ